VWSGAAKERGCCGDVVVGDTKHTANQGSVGREGSVWADERTRREREKKRSQR
jgi:hypothetical protein